MGINFLNKVRGKLGNVFIEFSKRTTFWDFLKWNREVRICDTGSITFFLLVIYN